jgi:hypothetical protein
VRNSSFLSSLTLCILLGGCTLPSTANHWNSRVGPDGESIYVKSHTNVGFNLFVGIPLFGSTTLPAEIDLLTHEIADEGGDKVRMIESSTENYWYGLPPLSWILTPVITTVTADYHPSPEVLAKDQAELEKEKKEEEENK